MQFKKILFSMFLFSMIHVGDVCAKEVKFPIDTVALEAALDQITIVRVSERDADIVAEAKADLYLYFMENKDKNISIKDIVKQCKKFIANSTSCMRFIETYNSYMDQTNACLTANNFKNVKYEGKTYSFQDCYNNSDFKRYYMNTDAVYDSDLTYDSSSLYGQCKRWIDAANICQKYLVNLYSQKLESTKDKNAKNTYTCVVEKIKSGEISFPLNREKLEGDCDEVKKQDAAAAMFEYFGF